MKSCLLTLALVFFPLFSLWAAPDAAPSRNVSLTPIHHTADPDLSGYVFNRRNQVLSEGYDYDSGDFFLERFSPGLGWEKLGSISYDNRKFMNDAGEIMITAPSMVQPGSTGLFRVIGESRQEILNESTIIAAALGSDGEAVACTPSMLKKVQRDGVATVTQFPADITPTGLTLLGDGTALISYNDAQSVKRYLIIRDGITTYLGADILPGNATIIGAWHSQVIFYLAERKQSVLYRSNLATPYSVYSRVLEHIAAGSWLNTLEASESGYILALSNAYGETEPIVVLPSGKVRRMNCLLKNSSRIVLSTTPQPRLNEAGKVLVPVGNLDLPGKKLRWAIVDMSMAGNQNYCSQVSTVLETKCRDSSSQYHPLAHGSVCRVQVRVKDSRGRPLPKQRVVAVDLGPWTPDADSGWFPGPSRTIATAFTDARGLARVLFHTSAGYRGIDIVAPYRDSKWRAADDGFMITAE